MRNHRRIAMLVAVSVLALAAAAPTVEAGGGFGLHFGSHGFGISVGVGDWSIYTSAWSDPYWALDYNTALSGYGEWVWVGGLGRVWRPWVKVGWQPYTHGRWVYTAYGWTWVAYEPWGYFPHHYGRWANSSFGWVWAPGYTYHAAGVVWVRAGGYVGWYAAPPRGWSHAAHGFHHGYNRGNDRRWHDARYATYVPWSHLGADNVSRHKVTHAVASRNRVETLALPPTTHEVRRHGGSPIVETRLSTRTAKVGGRQVTLARPEGVTRSIERHAPNTVRSTLAPAAQNVRQPRSRAGESPSLAHAPSRTSNSVSRSSRTATDVRRQRASAVDPSRNSGRSDARNLTRDWQTQSARTSQTAPTRTSGRKESRVSTTGMPSRSPRTATTERSRATSRDSSRKRVEASGRASSETPRSNAGRSPVRRSSAASEEKKESSSSDRSPRRTGARRR